MRNRKLVIGAVVIALLVPGAMVFANHDFSDVATTSPWHDSVSAIRNAGITAGCTPTKYCPDSSVTRGQMAVFLNKLGALGKVKGVATKPVVDALSVNGFFIQGDIEADPTEEGQTGIVLNGGGKSECATVSAGPNSFNTYSVVYQLFQTPVGLNPEEVNVQVRDDPATPEDQTWDLCFYRITTGNLSAGRYELYFQFTVFIGQGRFSGASTASSSDAPPRAGR
jgi:hypothetical protein